MAERAAHITSASRANRPSIFEVLAQDSLMSTIRPALKHAVKGERVLAENRPERFGWLLKWYDEFYTTLDFILQNYYLHNYNASFGENFYGMKRVSTENPALKILSPKVHWKSLLYLVFVPYIKHKIDEKFEEIRHRVNTGRHSKGDISSRLYRAFAGIYPYIHTSWEGTVLMYQLAYMFGKSKWHSPWIRLSEVELCNLELEDMEGVIKTEQNWNDSSSLERMKMVAAKAMNMTATGLSTGLSVGVFFLQFLDWWYANENSSPSQIMALPVPEAPVPNKDIEVPPYNVCPVCMRSRTNDTALSVSGYVFCYPCIHDYVNRYHCCPVTSFPANQGNLVRLYQPDT